MLNKARILTILDPEWQIEFDSPVTLVNQRGDRIKQRGNRWIAQFANGTLLQGERGARLFHHATAAAKALDREHRKLFWSKRRR